MVPIRHDVTPRTSVAGSGGRRYVLSVDLPIAAAPGSELRVDEVLTRAARELASAVPDVEPRLELLASVATPRPAGAEGSSPGHSWPAGRSRHGVPLLEVDVDARRVFVGDQLVQLAFKEFEILRLLVERPGAVVSRDEIAACIGHGDERPAPRTIDVHVHRIRTKLAETGDVISTVRGLGYRFNPSSSVVVA